MLTRKPNKAPAITSTSVWPIDYFKWAELQGTFAVPSSAAIMLGDTSIWPVCLVLFAVSSNKWELVEFGEKGLPSLDKRGPRFCSVACWESIRSSLIETIELTSVLSSTLFSAFAWFPTSLLTPCKSKSVYFQIKVWIQACCYSINQMKILI